MLAWWRSLQRARAGSRAFRNLPRNRRRIVFYAEGKGYWSYFGPVFEALRTRGVDVLYVTSEENDPLLEQAPAGLHPFYIGDASIRTLFFVDLACDVVVMTTPELHTSYLKRSPHGVHYVYLHHSLVSTHMVYPPDAFDYFDAILCAGPHHKEEIRAREHQRGLPPKILVEHGYGRLDTLLSVAKLAARNLTSAVPPQVLIAPSWGKEGLLDRHGVTIIASLLSANLRVVVRPHPRTFSEQPDMLAQIMRAFGEHPRFRLDNDPHSIRSLLDSDVMVSDWSGAALEFAFGRERPVLFVDVPRKCRNPSYATLAIEPLEVHIRSEIGVVLDPNALSTLAYHVIALITEAERWRSPIIGARQRWVYNLGRSGEAAADYLVSHLTTRPSHFVP